MRLRLFVRGMGLPVPPAVLRFAAVFAAVVLALAVPLPTRAQAPHPDFRVGDRILLSVQNEPTLSDTFTVTPALTVVLPAIGDVPLANVRRDQLTEHFTKVLSAYVRHPVVRARLLIRVGIVGEVARPGFYAVPADLVFSDALMVAGGPTKDARVDKLRVDRGNKHLLESDSLQRAMTRGATLDQLAFQSGDMINVPREQVGRKEAIVRIVAMLVTIPVAIYGMSHLR